MKTPLVSLIVPTYNRSEFILETIDSLVMQTYSNIEILIVDDASTDSTIEILDNYISHDSKISLIQRETNGGESAAVNTGWRKSKGNYVSIISSDDPQDSTWLEKMVELAESNPQHQFYYPNLRILDESGAIVQNLTLFSWSRPLIFQKLICIASAGTLIRKSNLPKDFLPRDEKIVYPSDLIQFLELSKVGSGLKADKVFGHWRRHNNSLTFNTDQVIRGIEFHKNVSKWIEKNKFEVYSNSLQIANAKLNLTIQTLLMIIEQYGKFGTFKKVVSSKELIKIVIKPGILIFIMPKLIIKVIRKLIIKQSHTFVRFYKSTFVYKFFLRIIRKLRYELKRKKIYKV